MKPNHRVEGITLVLYGEHPTLNEEGNVIPVNLGEYSVSTTNGEVQIDNEEELLKGVKKALRAIACTYLQNKLGANMNYNFNFGDIVEVINQAKEK